jgi:hypothetical protein
MSPRGCQLAAITREAKGGEHSFTPRDLLRPQLQGRDLNPRPPGYEPGELPDCSTLRRHDNRH